MWPVES